MKVLMNDGCRPSTAVVRGLAEAGVQVHVLTDSMQAPAWHSRYCAGAHFGPSPASPAFIARVMQILRQNSYDVFIPIGHEATLSCAEHRAELTKLTGLATVNGERLRQASDKGHAYQAGLKAGLPVPRTVHPATLPEARSLAADFRYPIVIKPGHETLGHSVCYARRAADFPAVYETFCAHHGFSEGNLPMVQEFIPGYGCGFFALYRHGVCKRIFMHRRVREYPPAGGVSSCAKSFFDLKLRNYGMRLLDSMNWHGLAMVEFRCDTRDGEFKLMEINPRFWGSLDLALAAGVNFPYDLCQIAQGRDLEYSETYRRGLRFQWPLLELRHVCKRPRSWWPFLRDLLNPKVKSDIWLRDLAPHWHESLELLRGGGRLVAAHFLPRTKEARERSSSAEDTVSEPVQTANT